MSASVKARAVHEYEFKQPILSDVITKKGRQILKSGRFDKKKNQKNSVSLMNDVVVPLVRNSTKSKDSLHPIDLRQMDLSQFKNQNDLERHPYYFQKDQDVLNWVAGMAQQSPITNALFKNAQDHGWMVVLDDLNQTNYQIESDIKLISLNHFGFVPHALGRSIHYKNALLVNFIKSLRQIWHTNQEYEYEATHRPDVVLMIERARTADCETLSILAAWELRNNGYGEVWRYVLGSEEGDMAMVFTRAIEKDPSGLYDGTVLTRTFCQWYGNSSRIAVHDHKVLEWMDAALKNNIQFGENPLRRSDIEQLSILPDGQIYLNGMGHNICTDPYFLSMNDAINESHLFQIVYDSKAVIIKGVPFRDKKLANLIFPTKKIKVLD